MSSTLELDVFDKMNADFGDFVPVSVAVDGLVYGCDVYTGTGPVTERGEVVARQIADWQDGNGLLSHGLATEEEVWAAVHKFYPEDPTGSAD